MDFNALVAGWYLPPGEFIQGTCSCCSREMPVQAKCLTAYGLGHGFKRGMRLEDSVIVAAATKTNSCSRACCGFIAACCQLLNAHALKAVDSGRKALQLGQHDPL